MKETLSDLTRKLEDLSHCIAKVNNRVDELNSELTELSDEFDNVDDLVTGLKIEYEESQEEAKAAKEATSDSKE